MLLILPWFLHFSSDPGGPSAKLQTACEPLPPLVIGSTCFVGLWHLLRKTKVWNAQEKWNLIYWSHAVSWSHSETTHTRAFRRIPRESLPGSTPASSMSFCTISLLFFRAKASHKCFVVRSPTNAWFSDQAVAILLSQHTFWTCYDSYIYVHKSISLHLKVIPLYLSAGVWGIKLDLQPIWVQTWWIVWPFSDLWLLVMLPNGKNHGMMRVWVAGHFGDLWVGNQRNQREQKFVQKPL